MAFGLVRSGTFAFGVSAEMWLDEHNRHHALTMRPSTGTFGSGDPQFDYLPMWLVSKKELATFHTRPAVERAVARILVPFRAFERTLCSGLSVVAVRLSAPSRLRLLGFVSFRRCAALFVLFSNLLTGALGKSQSTLRSCR